MLIAALIFYFQSGLKAMLADRAMVVTDFFLGTSTPFLVQYFLWSYVFAAGPDLIAGLNQEQTLFYYAFALVLGRLNNSYDLISKVSEQIREGSLEVQLVKPVGFMVSRLGIFLGESFLYLIPFGIVAGLYQLMVRVYDPAQLLMGIAVILASQTLSFFIGFTTGLLCFWLLESSVLLSSVLISSTVFGGLLLPPRFWPDSLQPFMLYNPFRFLVAGPAVYFVKPGWPSFQEFILGAVVYTAGLVFLSIHLWRRGLCRYHGAGG